MKKRGGRSMLKILEKSQNLPFESDPKLKGMMEQAKQDSEAEVCHV